MTDELKGRFRETGGSGNQTILLVEDYKDSREMIRLLLEDLSYRILEAQNGKEALDLASRETSDFVLTDFNLPDIDGTALIPVEARSPLQAGT